jgi:hypothetical protein
VVRGAPNYRIAGSLHIAIDDLLDAPGGHFRQLGHAAAGQNILGPPDRLIAFGLGDLLSLGE